MSETQKLLQEFYQEDEAILASYRKREPPTSISENLRKRPLTRHTPRCCENGTLAVTSISGLIGLISDGEVEAVLLRGELSKARS
ncbi:hypothetical protein MTO96_047398 [Rhipicephalus appendiculatus]